MMNFKMRLKTVVAMLAVAVMAATAQEAMPTMQITLDKAIEFALSENPITAMTKSVCLLKALMKCLMS